MSARKRMGHSICMNAAPGANWELPPPDAAELLQLFVRDVAQFDRLSKLLGTPNDGSSVRMGIAELRQSLTKQTTAVMEAVQSMDVSDPSEKQKQEKIVSSFRSAVEQYQRIVNYCKEAERRFPIDTPQMDTPMGGFGGNNYNNYNNGGMLPEEYNNNGSRGDEFSLLGNNNYYEQQIVFDPNKLVMYDDHDVAIIEERNQEIRQIAEDMKGLQEIYQEVGTTVQEQAPVLEKVEEQVHVAQETAVEATHEIAKAGKLKKGKFMAKGAGAGAVAGAVAGAAAGTVLGPIGTLAGAAIGGAIGGIVGAGGGKKVAEKQQSQIDQELFYHDISHRWQPDEEVTNCRNCNKEFSAIRRKHHCRRCGYIYCKKCTDFRAKVQTNSIEFDRDVRVCINCFYGRPVPGQPAPHNRSHSPQASMVQQPHPSIKQMSQPSMAPQQSMKQPQPSMGRPLQPQQSISQPQLSQHYPDQNHSPQSSFNASYGQPQQYQPQPSYSPPMQAQYGAPMYNNNMNYPQQNNY